MLIGSWPGYAANHNPFMPIFLDALADAGATISSLESVEEMLQADVDVILLHWAETVFWQSSDRYKLIANIMRLRRFFARRGTQRPKLLWIAHNLAPHRPKRLQKLVWPSYMSALTDGVDGVLTFAPGTVEVVHRSFPQLATKPTGWTWHPRYPEPRLNRHQARILLGIAQEVHLFGCCGQIRSYKGIDLAVDAFRRTQSPTARLLLAGNPVDADVVAALRTIAARDPRILLMFEDLSAEVFERALVACDTVVAPFRHYLHSGSLVHALSAGARIVTPSTPFSDNLCDLLGPDLVTAYTGDLTPELLMHQTLRVSSRRAPLDALAPDRVARDVLEFVQRL